MNHDLLSSITIAAVAVFIALVIFRPPPSHP
jgi:hypothetical protein